MTAQTTATLESILELYERHGADHYGEGVSQLAHALQTATLAAEEGVADELVCAALLHDVGHLVAEPDTALKDGERDDRHEHVGSRLLERVFGDAVARPVALHVVAKRWRCAVEDSYKDELSAASRASLRAQGGPLPEAACRNFEASPWFDEAVRLRGWDDRAKVLGAATAPLGAFHPALRHLADVARHANVDG